MMFNDDLLVYKDRVGWCYLYMPYTGTAFSFTYKDVFHYKNGMFHREDGPAVEYTDGEPVWYINDERIFTWKRYHELSTLTPQEQMVVKLTYGEQLR